MAPAEKHVGLFGEACAEAADELAICRGGKAMDDLALGDAAQERALDHHLSGDARDERADLRNDGDKAKGGQAIDGVADGGPRDAEFLGDGVLGQRRAGLDVDLEDGVEENVEDRVAAGARSAEGEAAISQAE